jgi:hypothetical protein
MKLQRHVKTAFAAALATSLSAGGIASAYVKDDTLKYIISPGATQTAQLGGAGNYNSTLASSGFASESYLYLQGSTSSDDLIQTTATDTGTQNGGMLGVGNGNNVAASGFDLGNFALQGPAGTDGSYEVITSITLLLYVTGASITAPDPVISIYAGLNNATGVGALGSYSVGQSQVGSYISIDIPASVAFSGFTLADLVRRNPQDLANYGTEDNTTIAFQPAYRVNTIYVIPEPSAALLGALGSLTLLRRRRRGNSDILV